MAFPAGVETATCTVGSALDFQGEGVELTADLKVILGGEATYIVWEATGQTFNTMLEELSAAAGAELEFELPLVDQAGFIGPDGSAVTFWAYEIEVQARRGRT